jgi:hypothetical protein
LIAGIDGQHAEQAVSLLVGRVNHTAQPEPGSHVLWVVVQQAGEQVPCPLSVTAVDSLYSLL